MKPLGRQVLLPCMLLVLAVASGAAESYQPGSHVTRGIYAHLNPVVRAGVWSAWGSGFDYVGDKPHGGKACIRCVGGNGQPGQGVGQTVELKQTAPKPVRIAGWSRCEGVEGEPSYHYSLYVDFVFADGTPWHMKLATFATGTHGWQHAETVLTPPKPLHSARFHAFIREIGGTVWLDDLWLGEAGGPNLLKCPGFEKGDRIDLAARTQLFDDLNGLHCNAIHGYLGGNLPDWDEPPSERSDIAGFLRQARDRGIGVWLTTHIGGLPIRDTDDPAFPQRYCVNGDWGRRWTATLAKIARYPFAGLSMVPDEYNWNNGRLKRWYARHRDPKVRDFYSKLPSYCNCPDCRERFAKAFGKPLPAKVPTPEWLRFRYDSTTDWLRRTCAAVKQANPHIRTDSLICVTPLCSDLWYGPGIAWDRAGYEAGLEYATTDPYILLHNYLGDSTHWYVTETAEHLAAASPERRCGIVLEGSRLRKEHRELDPVEIYGSALSAVWHGADELAFFHRVHVMGTSGVTARPEVSQSCIRGLYGLLEKIDPWLDGLTPEPGIALLFSRASCDAWRLGVQAKERKPPFTLLGSANPRYGSIVQKEVLYTLLRVGVPTTLYYLESVRKDELAGHKVIIIPFPLAVSRRQAKLIGALAREGKRIVVFGIDGPLDEDGTLHERPVLGDLVRYGGAPPKVREKLVEPLEGLAHEISFRELGVVGDVSGAFVSAGALDALAAPRGNEKRTRTERIFPAPFPQQLATLILLASTNLNDGIDVTQLLDERLPNGQDVELSLAVNRRGETLFLAINWDSRERAIALLPKRPCFDRPPREAYLLGSDGAWAPWAGSFRPELKLKGQEALVARLAGE